MGSGRSKEQVKSTYAYSEKRSVRNTEDLSQRFAQYLTLDGGISGEANPISTSNLGEWSDELLSEPKNRLAQNAICNVEVKSIIRQRKAVVSDAVQVFSDKIEFEGGPITNQQSSGRCWIFASTNVFRTFLQKKYNIEEFQLSQSYLFFYDKLEKCNFFFQNIIETADEPLDSRLVQTLMHEPISDGGQWDMIVNLVEKYGLVPQTTFPDSYNATHSSTLNYVVIHKLREYGLVLRKLAIDKTVSTASINSLKEKFVREMYGVIALALGEPPKPNDSFTWEYYDKTGKFHSVSTTPINFYKELVGYDAGSHFSLINDPRNAYKALYTVDRLGNILGGKSIEYVNAGIDVLKKAAIKSIQNNEPVFFGSDVGQFSDSVDGVMDTNVWDYELAFNTKLGLTKEERLRVGASSMTHAMVLTAVHLVDGKSTKWKVENSWGDRQEIKDTLSCLMIGLTSMFSRSLLVQSMPRRSMWIFTTVNNITY